MEQPVPQLPPAQQPSGAVSSTSDREALSDVLIRFIQANRILLDRLDFGSLVFEADVRSKLIVHAEVTHSFTRREQLQKEIPGGIQITLGEE